ncbi:glycolipid transfer protein domain-containing protein [Protomyces lactucae-debilis]|uniref:Glycolipid transfer protein domain-containing protein n=1 Tax=Protomyces lactucae-debilis TaxID=2754530 RepID=A0A1Y2FQK8_PROLT|nr:glycolipid transfer protein domain-containing protein [Protomyces lactucae-debilis]ORY86270.1 glycolipid transfer protein domain-containing protein [Protomyces lactucae-debilis]
MSTWFDQQKRQWPEVPITEQGVSTTEFLEAATALVKLFDLLGSSAFAIVQNDMTGNINKIKARQQSHPAQCASLEQLVKGEVTEKKRTATEGLLWLLRGLAFTALALRRSLDNPSEELAVSFTQAYGDTLKKHHSFVVKPLFTLAMKACPYRKDFYAKLGADQAKVTSQLEANTAALQKIVKQLEVFYETGKYGKGF